MEKNNNSPSFAHDRVDIAIAGQQIVYAANDWRTDNRTSSHHIASRLAKENTILYLEAAGQRAPRASGRDIKRILSRVSKAFKAPTRVTENVYVLSPLILPFHRYRTIRYLNELILRLTVRRSCRMLSFDHPIVWMTIPHYGAIMDAMPVKGVVYYCIDDFASFPNTDRNAMQRMEDRILDRADIVFAVSEPLFEKKRASNPNTFFSPHGVDTEHFGAAMSADTRVPEDIASIPPPIAGFFGLVEEWFDTDLLDYCASQLKDVSFVVIGRVARDTGNLAAHRNVHFLGPRPYEVIPNYLKAFNVGLIPFRLTDTILYSNPLKFKEYLAGGKPVVSVRIQAFEKHKDLAYLVDSYDQFSNAIRRAIEEDSADKVRARVMAMQKESWDTRVKEVCNRVHTHLFE
jgi:glycosyltransferase involved in cell wall biosynthesis